MRFLGTRTATPTCTAAASTLVHGVLAGPVHPATPVAAGRSASYLDVGGDLVAVVAPGAVALPCAIVLAPGGEGALAALGRSAGAGRGRLGIGDGAVWCDGEPVVTVRRWFDPRVRVRSIDPAAAGRLSATVRAVPPPDPAVPGAAASTDLLGRGAGLTPSGDDLVAGYLAALRARGLPAADALGAEVRRLAPRRTTRLSAALLAAADRGALVPEAAAVLRAAGGDGDVEAATRRLLALGHTSGWYLAAGLAAGCAA